MVEHIGQMASMALLAHTHYFTEIFHDNFASVGAGLNALFQCRGGCGLVGIGL